MPRTHDPKVKPEAVAACEHATEALLFDGPTLRTDRYEALAKSPAWREAFNAFLDGNSIEEMPKDQVLGYISAVLGTTGSRRLMGDLTSQMTKHGIRIGFEPAYDIFYDQTTPIVTRELPTASARSLFSQLDNRQLQQVIGHAEPGMFARAAASTLTERLTPTPHTPSQPIGPWADVSVKRGHNVLEAMDAAMRDPEALKARLAAGQYRSPWAERVQTQESQPDKANGR